MDSPSASALSAAPSPAEVPPESDQGVLAPTDDSVSAAAPAVPPLPVVEEPSPPAPEEIPEKPSAVSRVAAPARSLPDMLSEEPDTPFGESSPVVLPPPETTIVLGDAPLPVVPTLPEPPKSVAAPIPSPAAPPPAPMNADERPSVSLSVAPPGAAKPAPAKQEPPKAPPANEPARSPAVSAVSDLPAQASRLSTEDRVDFSRTVRMLVGQLLEIPYRGAGWVYLGERNARKGLPYDSRRLDQDGQSFMFRAEAPGTYVLKFYRQDFVADYIVNDYVQVTVDPAPSASSVGVFSVPLDRGRVIAEPRWPAAQEPLSSTEAAPERAAPSSAQAAVSAVPQNDPGIVREIAPTAVVASAPASAPTSATEAPLDPAAISPNASMEEYLDLAQKEAEAGKTASALGVLTRAFQFYPAGSDELWWLSGRLLESNGPTKDVKAALASYKKLIDEYPQSPRYDDAVKRAAYLERYFFEIR